MEIVDINNKKFIKVKLLEVAQKDKSFYVGKIKAKDFINIFTVEPAEYDLKKQATFASKFEGDSEYYDYLINEDKKHIDDKSFQRKENTNRINDIKKFLISEDFAFFPNTIIATCDLLNEMTSNEPAGLIENLDDLEISDQDMNLAIFDERDGNQYLYIPYTQGSILIIDGQHRLKGLEKAVAEGLGDYEVLVSFLIGLNRSVLAQLFYTINYTQKSVNKSLLYHLSGEFSRELNEIKFLHEIIKILNEIEKSPFFGRIKMLGVLPSNIDEEGKKLMTISQAFLLDYLIPMISESAIKSIYQPIFLYLFRNPDYQIEIARFLIKYFTAISKLGGEGWNSPDDNVISKSISVGAFIRVLHFLFVKLFVEELKFDVQKIRDLTEDDFTRMMAGMENIDFSADGPHGGVGSAGNLNKIKRELIENINYFQASDYDSFLNNFKTKYQPQFINWLKKNL